MSRYKYLWKPAYPCRYKKMDESAAQKSLAEVTEVAALYESRFLPQGRVYLTDVSTHHLTINAVMVTTFKCKIVSQMFSINRYVFDGKELQSHSLQIFIFINLIKFRLKSLSEVN